MLRLAIGLFLFVNFLGFRVSAQDTIMRKEYTRKGNLVYYKDSLFTGVALKKSGNGIVVAEERYSKGLADGLWREWWESGEKKFEGAFLNGKNDGVWTEWYPDGKVKKKLIFNNGQFVKEEQ